MIKIAKKLQYIYLRYYNLLIAKNIWQVLYQIFSKIFLKELNRVKCKFGHDDKKCEKCRTKYKYCDCFLENSNVKGDLTEYKCLCCDKNYQHKFDDKLKERFFNTYTFCDYDNNKFILLLKEGAYPFEYMDDWEKFNETLAPEKEDFYSHLYVEDITDADYAHGK